MIANLAFLTEPSRGVYLLNVTDTAGAFQRIEITKAQLSGILVAGTGMVLRESDINVTLQHFLTEREGGTNA